MDLATLVNDVVDDLTSCDKTFTAFDVTTELRVDNPSEDIFHYEVRPLVHSRMDNAVNCGTYAKTQDFNINSGGPFVYTPVRINTVLPKMFTAIKKVQKFDPPTTHVVGSRGRLSVPKADMSYLGKSNLVDLIIKKNNPKGISIMDEDAVAGDGDAKLVVDCYGAIKISPTTLENGSIDTTKPIYIHKTTFNKKPELIITNKEKLS